MGVFPNGSLRLRCGYHGYELGDRRHSRCELTLVDQQRWTRQEFSRAKRTLRTKHKTSILLKHYKSCAQRQVKVPTLSERKPMHSNYRSRSPLIIDKCQKYLAFSSNHTSLPSLAAKKAPTPCPFPTAAADRVTSHEMISH